MKLYFDIPPKEHRGWPGHSDVTIDKRGIIIVPCGASGSINGGHDYRYHIEISAKDLFVFAFKKLLKNLER